MLSLTPSLIYFKFVSTGTILDSNADGHYWERLIQAKLSLLKNFEFFFTYEMNAIKETMPTLDSLITSFQTPFWIEDSAGLLLVIMLSL